VAADKDKDYTLMTAGCVGGGSDLCAGRQEQQYKSKVADRSKDIPGAFDLSWDPNEDKKLHHTHGRRFVSPSTKTNFKTRDKGERPPGTPAHTFCSDRNGIIRWV
jgi:hypothetical protein